jgi:hypothetical protein
MDVDGGSSIQHSINHAAGGNRLAPLASSAANTPAAAANTAAEPSVVQQRQPRSLQQAGSSGCASPDGSRSGSGLQPALQLFQGGVSSMQALLDTLLASAQSEQQQLEEARQQLEADRAAFEQETAAVQVSSCLPLVITFLCVAAAVAVLAALLCATQA